MTEQMSSTISQELCRVNLDFFFYTQLHYGLQGRIQIYNAEICSANLLEHLHVPDTQARRTVPYVQRAQGSV